MAGVSKSTERLVNVIVCMGAAIVIFGAWQKITHQGTEKGWAPAPNEPEHLVEVHNNLPGDVEGYNFIVNQMGLYK